MVAASMSFERPSLPRRRTIDLPPTMEDDVECHEPYNKVDGGAGHFAQHYQGCRDKVSFEMVSAHCRRSAYNQHAQFDPSTECNALRLQLFWPRRRKRAWDEGEVHAHQSDDD